MQIQLPQGIYHDVLTRAGAAGIDFGWRSNVVVNDCRVLLAAFMKGDTALGIQRIDLGRGDSLWDSSMYTPPSETTASLVDTTFRSISTADADMQIDFIDSVGAVTSSPTNRLEITVNINSSSFPLGAGEVFPLREFALIGRRGTTDYMIDYVRHPVINISTGDVLVRKVRLTF
ncbi:MAG: hypothetical protein GC149_14145 [Gammaproteobacteria bacterium]|nr:hypothetical protein [Gammaproteobacteria bacterium]